MKNIIKAKASCLWSENPRGLVCDVNDMRVALMDLDADHDAFYGVFGGGFTVVVPKYLEAKCKELTDLLEEKEIVNTIYHGCTNDAYVYPSIKNFPVSPFYAIITNVSDESVEGVTFKPIGFKISIGKITS